METNISDVALALFGAGTVVDTLQRIVDLAVLTIEGCDSCGIFLLNGEESATAAYSDPIVVHIDGLQVQSGEGPSLAAISEGGTTYAEDLECDPRWPTFGPRATAAGIPGALAFRLSTRRSSALNLYARRPGAFGETERAAGLSFATLAGLALVSAIDREDDARRTANLREALRSRELIGQAQGILMERERITADQAFDRLRRASQFRNVKLREVAHSIVETGESPENAAGSRP